MDQMLIWGHKFFSTELSDSLVCRPFFVVDFTAWFYTMSFLQNYPKASCIFTRAYFNLRHSNHSLLRICCVITLAHFFPFKSRTDRPSSVTCFAQNSNSSSASFSRLHEILQLWHNLFHFAIRLYFAIDLYGFCVGEQRWPQELSRRGHVGGHYLYRWSVLQ